VQAGVTASCKLASVIIKAQEGEISMMQEWLKKRGLQ